MPQADLPLEVQHAHHVLAFGVVARHCQSSAVRQHGCSGNRHTHHGAITVSRILKSKRNIRVRHRSKTKLA